MSQVANVDEVMKRLASVGVRAIDAAPWINEIESRLGSKLPGDFRAVVTRYTFPVLPLQTVELFANVGDHSENDLTVAPFRDPGLSQWLTSHKLFQIGRPSSGSYDPVCVEVGSNNPVVVRLDHEAILLGRGSVRRETVAPSIVSVLSEHIDA